MDDNRYRLSGDERGVLAEKMVLDAVCYKKPQWLFIVRKASSVLDVNGIDLIATIRYPNGDIGQVPIQVKCGTDETKRGRYYRKHPEARRLKVPVLLIGLRDDTTTICLKLYDELITVRKENRRYNDYIQKLDTMELDEKGLEYQQMILERERLNPKNPHRPRDSSKGDRLRLATICLI